MRQPKLARYRLITHPEVPADLTTSGCKGDREYNVADEIGVHPVLGLFGLGHLC